MTLADVTQHARRIPFTVLYKDVFGCAVAAVAAIGALYAVFQADFPTEGQAIVALLGGAAGAVGAWISSRPIT